MPYLYHKFCYKKKMSKHKPIRFPDLILLQTVFLKGLHEINI